MIQPVLHVQNIFDALNPHGSGVNGHLKLKCLQLQNRVAGLANSGDIIAISDDCSETFVNYILRTTRVSDVLSLRYPVSPNLREYLDAHSVFNELVQDPSWEATVKRHPVLSPYMKSPAVYQAARAAGITVSQREWEAVVTDCLTEKMNDKSIFYRECDEAGIPVPRHWVVGGTELIDCVVELLKIGHNPLYIRQTRSAGTFGNITTERVNSSYLIHEWKTHALGDKEFVQNLEKFIKTSLSDEFVISEMLDLYASPGTLFYAGDVDVTVICHTYQILDKNRFFLGFMYPIEDKKVKKHFGVIEEWLRSVIEPWRQRGYRGYGNIDWMITKEGDSFFAERNTRQTAVVPPLSIANACSKLPRRNSSIVAPVFSIFTNDNVKLERATTFEEVYALLRKKRLLWEQSKHGEGVIITIPPSPQFGINTVGIMALASDLPTVYEIYSRALEAFGSQENELLFELKI